eukprot:5306379-Pyramimonas_sp.AAC.1
MKSARERRRAVCGEREGRCRGVVGRRARGRRGSRRRGRARVRLAEKLWGMRWQESAAGAARWRCELDRKRDPRAVLECDVLGA